MAFFEGNFIYFNLEHNNFLHEDYHKGDKYKNKFSEGSIISLEKDVLSRFLNTFER